MNETSDFWFLENVDMFQFICPSKMEAMGEERRAEITFEFKRGEFIYFTNEVANQVYLLFSGRVKLGMYSEEGKEIIKSILQPGELFGEMAIIGESVRRDFAMAMDDHVRVCVMGLKEMKQLMYDDVDFSLKITRLIGLKLQRMERRLESLVFKDARTRIVDFLRDLGETKGTKVGDETLVLTFYTQKDIASLTANSLQTVTSILNELRDQNLIYFDRKRLLIRDMEMLK
ncbi:MAG: Crp/Fnr family transcriptional regulator [Bacteroidota bacterium]